VLWVLADSTAQRVESQVQVTYTLVIFTIPLLVAVITAVVAAFYQIRQAVAAGQANHALLHSVIAPALDAVQARMEATHVTVQALANGTNGGTDPGAGTGAGSGASHTG
jgi:hypothetical protein